MFYGRLFAVTLTLSLLLSASAASQPKDLQEKMLSYLRNPLMLSDDSLSAYLRDASLLAISDEDAQATQASYTLNLSNLIIPYTQGRLHDNVSTVTEGYSLRFTVTESMPSGQNQTVWMRLPKNITLVNTSMSIAGLMSSASAKLDSKVYSVAIGEESGAYNAREIVAGTDDGHVYVLTSTGVKITPLTKTLEYPIYAVATGDITSRVNEEYVVGLSNGTVFVFNNAGTQVWTYTASNYPVYALDVGNVTKGLYEDVVVGTWDKKVILLNSTGSQIWNYTVGSEVHDVAIGNVTADDGNEIVVGSYDGRVYVLNRTGSQVWNYSAGGWVLGVAVGDFNSSSAGNEVIYTSNDFKAYVLNGAGSSVLYSFPTGNYVSDAAIGDVLQDAGSELVVGSWDKVAYVVNASGNLSANRTTLGFVYDVDIGEVFTEDGLEVVAASGDTYVYIMNFRFFTKNPYIDIASSGAPYEWNYTGIFRESNTLNTSFLSLVQTRLSSCTTTYCDVAFLGHSEESGVLSITPIVSYTYNATGIINSTLIPTGFSKTQYITINETVGTEVLNITYLARPLQNITVKYIVAGASATECDFNSQDYLVSTVNGQKVCDITAAGRVVPSSALYDLPTPDLYWDDSMSGVKPAVMVEEAPAYFSGTWRKNFTIINGSSTLFRNIIAYTTVNDSLFAQELRVEWYSNGTYYDITPEIVRADCNTTTPTYAGLTVGSDVFYVCKQDLDGDEIVDYFKWIQPYINRTSRYYAASYFDEAPTLTNVNVTPQEAPWGSVFNYSASVFDQENQLVEVVLYVKVGNATSYSEAGRRNITGSGIASFNITSNVSWVGTNNSFYLAYTDFSHPLYQTANYSLPRVTGHIILFENVSGNNTAVARKGLATATLAVTLRDRELNQTVGANVNCSFSVRKNGVYADPVVAATDAGGRCTYAFDPDNTYKPGQRKWYVEVSNNTKYMSVNSTEYYVNVTGEANLSLTSQGGRLVRGQPMVLLANLVDEFQQDAEISGATCRWYLDNTFRGTSNTNNTGYCVRTETTGCDTWSLGEYSLNVTLDPLGSIFWTVLKNATNGTVYLTDLVSLAIDGPPNASIIYKGDTVALTSTALPSVCAFPADPNQIHWYLGDTTIAAKEDSNWTVSIAETVGPKNLSVNATGNYSSTPKTQLVYIYGYAAVQSISPAAGTFVRGTEVSFTCKVVDANLSSGIQNYTLSFYKNGSLVNTTQTDLLGEAVWAWDTTNESEGNYNITCMIGNASNLYYTASAANRKEASVAVTFRMGVLNITFSNTSIYRNDSFSPNAVNITAMVGKSISNPVSGATIHIYLPLGAYANCTTDAQGYCSLSYNPPDNMTPDNYSLYFNATKEGELSSFTEERFLEVKGLLNISLDTPSGGRVVYHGDSVSMSSSILDENRNVVPNVVVKWNDSTSLLALGEDTLWAVSLNQTLGPTGIYVLASKSHYTSSTANTSVAVWGWAQPMWVSPKLEMSYGVATYLVCNVSDSNSTAGVGNYPVSFYVNNTLIGANTTIGNGEARIVYTATSQSTHVFKCGIANAADLYYNASSEYSDEEYVFVYPLRTFTGDVLDAAGRPTNTTFRLYAPGTTELIREFSTDASGRYSVYVLNKSSDFVMTLNELRATVAFDDVDFTSIPNDPVDFDLVSGTETTLVNDVRGFAVNTTYFKGPATIAINYSESDVVESEDYLSIYYCADWNYTSRRCLGEWIQLKDAVVDKPRNTVAVNVSNVTTTGKTAYMIAENLPLERPPRIGFVNATPVYVAPGGNVSVTVSVSDVDLDLVNATLGSLTVTLNYNASTGLFEYGNLTAPTAEGEYALTILAADRAGNTVSDTQTVIYVDGTNPIIRLISPQDGSQMRAGTTVNLSITDATLDVVWYRLDGGANTTLASPYLIASTGWAEGAHTLTVWARDKVGHVETKTFTLTVNNTIVAFTLSAVHATSIELGRTAVIEVNVTSGLSVSQVTAAVTYPSGNAVNYPMTNDSARHYATSLSGLVELGDYDVVVTARDSGGNTVAQSGWFEVYVLREFYGDVLDALNQPVAATFKLYRPNATSLIEEFATDSNGEYNLRVHNRTVDMELTAFNAKMLLEDVNLASLANDPVDIDGIDGSDIYVPGENALKGVALKLSTPFGGRLTFNYGAGDVSFKNNTEIYECVSWDYATRICSVNWTDLNATDNRLQNSVQSNVTAFSAYALTENLFCGNKVCEKEWGENCFVCETDCGSCDILANITVQARRPPTVDLSPLEETLANHSAQLQELKKVIEEFRAGVNLSALESRIREQFLTVEDISTILSMSRRAQALVPGLQIVSAELYPGESIKTSIHVKNTLEETSLVYLNVTGKIAEFISFEKPIIELPGYGEDDVSVMVFIPLNTPPAAYYGELKIISGDVVANIPVNLRVLESREKILDLKIQVLGEEITPGDQLRVEASIYNLGGRAKVEGQLTLQLVDIRTNDAIFERTDNVSVETTISVVKTMNLTSDVPEGRYVVRGKVSYVDLGGNVQQVSSIGYVTVSKSFFQLTFYGIPIWLILFTVFTLTAVYALYFVRRRQIERRRRYLEAITFKTLPQPGPRSGFIGRIAETDIRAFIEIDKG